MVHVHASLNIVFMEVFVMHCIFMNWICRAYVWPTCQLFAPILLMVFQNYIQIR